MPIRQDLETTRKTPRQNRAASTVEALVEAAFQVLERDGGERFGTTAVAERAGVSIGTLYQYFSRKEDLLVAVARRELRALLAGIERELSEPPGAQRVRAVARAVLGAFRQAAAGRRASLGLLLAYVDRGEIAAEARAFTSELARELSGQRQLGAEAAFVLTRAVLGVASAAMTEDQALSPQRLEDELVLLIQSYLGAGAAQNL
jgi:AcrR family transcriptional regulator